MTDLGISLSAATTMFLKQVVYCNAVHTMAIKNRE